MAAPLSPAIILLPTAPVPHSYCEPAACVPPDAVSVVLLPRQIVNEPLIPVGAVDGMATLTVNVAPEVLALQAPVSAILTQYVVVTVGEKVAVWPVAMTVPVPTTVPIPH